MTPEQWEKVEDVLFQALQLPEAQWHAFVDRACSGEVAVKMEVLSLLAYHDGERDDSPESPRTVRTWGPDAPTDAVIGGYRIVRPIAQGGMGRVLLARREDLAYR